MDDLHTRTLADQMRITDAEIRERKGLLGLTLKDEEDLYALHTAANETVDAIVDEFYARQTATPQIRTIIGDSDTLSRLQRAMRSYIITLFSGNYGADYVNSRLRIGKVHARIGVPPKLYVSSMYQLESLVGSFVASAAGRDAPPEALQKLFLFDLQLVFDTYVQGLVSEVSFARDEITRYSANLETIVHTRTAQLQQQALSDALSGLRNRRAFFEDASALLAKASVGTGDRTEFVGLLFLDLDGFKHINDTKGHVEGDNVIKAVAQVLRDEVGGDKLAYRYGGDEFCVLLTHMTEAEMRTLQASLVAAVTAVLPKGVGVSAGMACARPEDVVNVDALINEADRAMYAKKTENRRASAQKLVPVAVEAP